ncbi:hypothetical protein ACSBR2_006232 [Camellia fascicularis]
MSAGDVSLSGSIRAGTNGFGRHALGSCVDYDLPSFCGSIEIDSSSVLIDELPFTMDDNFVELSCEPYAKDLLLGAQSRHGIFREDFLVKAFYEAEKAHRGQRFCSLWLGANLTVVAAGLLHDTLDDSSMSYDCIFHTLELGLLIWLKGDSHLQEFWIILLLPCFDYVHLVHHSTFCSRYRDSYINICNNLVKVSKLSQLSKLAHDNNTASKTIEADCLHTMFLAMADARAVLIKLADRLHNMMTLHALPLVKQQRFAKEALEIFAPLANRLGIFSWKEKLENLCFKYL